jgi:chorismate synthase
MIKSDGHQHVLAGETEPEKFAELIEKYNLLEKRLIRCPHVPTALNIMAVIEKTKSEKDSVGGTITTVCAGVPPGLGEPCFDKVQPRRL